MMLALLRAIGNNVKFNHVRPTIYHFYTTTAPQSNKKKEKLAAKLVAKAPKPIQPYLKLVRWDKPTGMGLMYAPFSWGIASATPCGCLPDLYTLALILPTSIVLRGAACTVNDILDKDLDAQVSRTKNRPLPSGEISTTKAWIFLGAQVGAVSLVMAQFGWYNITLTAVHVLLLFLYPLLKRVTYWPQAWLGAAYNWGVLSGYSVLTGNIDIAMCLPLYLSSICWTLIYDTIYGSQDKVDDVKVGIKGTAVKFGENTKLWLSGFGTLMMSGLVTAGVLNEMAWPYYVSLGLVGTHICWQLATVRLDNPRDCGSKFDSNPQIGLILLCGIVLGILYKKKEAPNDDVKKKLVYLDDSIVAGG